MSSHHTDKKHSSTKRISVVIPQIHEREFGESLGARTNMLPTFKELGPPDLVHFSRYQKSTQRDVGYYHFVTGLDISSTDAPVAYLSTIQLGSGTTSAKHPQIATYCSWNCFTKGDVRMRIELTNGGNKTVQLIPGDHRQVSLHGTLEDSVWRETYVSGLIRSIIFCNDPSRQLPGLHQLNPVSSTISCKRALSEMVALLPNGRLTGCRTTVQQPTLTQNHLVDALVILAKLTNLQQFVIDQMEKLPQTAFAPLLVDLLISQDKEIEAVNLLHQSIKRNPRDSAVLNKQTNYLLSKNRPDLAVLPILRAVESSPMEFEYWATLVKVHLANKCYADALLALNSCPMYAARPRDISKPLTPRATTFEQPSEGYFEGVWEVAMSPIFGENADGVVEFSSQKQVDAVDPMFLRVYNATKFKATFAVAYDLLCLITRAVGWDHLLKLRSQVFVMEEEYTTVEGVRAKRLCERWLDNLFLILYDDLRVVLMWENERRSEGYDVKHSALEWELIGLAALRTHHDEAGLIALKTALSARYSHVAALKLLNYYLEFVSDTTQFMELNPKIKYRNILACLPTDFMLKTVAQICSWEYRWYGEFHTKVLSFLKSSCETEGGTYMKSLVQVQFPNDTVDCLLDRYISWCQQFEV